jgi:predicted molibdopterin-dependent oxidoreductase YjgC
MEKRMAPPILRRIAEFDSPLVTFTLDGKSVQARQGESVLAAVLSQSGHLRTHETTGEPRAGFCLMGTCQDCWMWFGPDRRGRACTTPVVEGMRVSTSPIPASRLG